MARGRPFGPAQQAVLAALRKRAHSLDELVAIVEPFALSRERVTVMLGSLKHRGYVRHAGRVASGVGRKRQAVYAWVPRSTEAKGAARRMRRARRVGSLVTALNLPAWLAPRAPLPTAALTVRRVTGAASVAEATAARELAGLL